MSTNPITQKLGADGSAVTGTAAGGAQANNAALAAVAAKMNFVSGFEITGGGATAASIITVTLTGVLGGTLQYRIPVPAGATVGITPLVVQFDPPLPASAVNTAITINVPSFGAGNTDAAATIHGYQQ